MFAFAFICVVAVGAWADAGEPVIHLDSIRLGSRGTKVALDRKWGPEQATGEPDTHEAGDRTTAWAPRERNDGIEWLKLDYDRAVDIAEVRIRETFNPGAVVKVTALADAGEEQLLWAGQDPTTDAPAEFSIPSDGNVRGDAVMVYLDTSRRSGWNEIDAVELVGADGSRQWATSASASSTYAERTARRIRATSRRASRPPEPFLEMIGKRVIVHLEGGYAVNGTLERAGSEFLVIRQHGSNKTLIANVGKIVFLESSSRRAAAVRQPAQRRRWPGLTGFWSFVRAAERGDRSRIQQLLREGADINTTEPKRRRTALHYHAIRKNANSVRLLLESGADHTVEDYNGNRPIHRAAKVGSQEIVQMFIDYGAKLDILTAACIGRYDAVARFVRSDRSLVHREIAGWRPLHGAAENGHAKVAEFLLDHGAYVNALDYGGTGWTPLHRVAATGHRSVAIELLRRGADVTIRSGDPVESPIDVARRLRPDDHWLHRSLRNADRRRRPSWNILGADLFRRRRRPEHSEYWSFVDAAQKGNLVRIRQHIVEGRDINAIGPESGRTPLHYHAALGNSRSVQVLLRAEANFRSKDYFGNTPLHLAAKRNFREMANLFFESGAENDIVVAACLGMTNEIKRILESDKESINREIAGWTPLHAAAALRRHEIVEVLLEAGAEVNRQDFGGVGLTPLHRAAAHGDRHVVRLLLAQGADVSIRENVETRETAIDVARRLQPHDDELLWLLLQKKFEKKDRSN
jgi:ankyrin repeat protein